MAAPTRLKSSFIYLANAVNDLRGSWKILAAVLAPLVVVAALFLLPDALNFQHLVAQQFEPGARSIAYLPVQEPYPAPQAMNVAPLFPQWVLIIFRVIALLIVPQTVNLVVMCLIKRGQNKVNRPGILSEAIGVYRDSIRLFLPFAWITILIIVATLVGLVLLVIPGLLAFIWLYFGQYALVFDDIHSWPALFHSRDLTRKRFFKVAIRVVVFWALWSGYNSWAGGAFFVVSILLGPIVYFTGAIWAVIFALDLLWIGVAFVTTAFFVYAGLRLYQDLGQIVQEASTTTTTAAVDPPTAPLPSVSA